MVTVPPSYVIRFKKEEKLGVLMCRELLEVGKSRKCLSDWVGFFDVILGGLSTGFRLHLFCFNIKMIHCISTTCWKRFLSTLHRHKRTSQGLSVAVTHRGENRLIITFFFLFLEDSSYNSLWLHIFILFYF